LNPGQAALFAQLAKNAAPLAPVAAAWTPYLYARNLGFSAGKRA
jgi:hypothetical protein